MSGNKSLELYVSILLFCESLPCNMVSATTFIMVPLQCHHWIVTGYFGQSYTDESV